jgi:predicted PurR-regulated permease PerM
MSESTFAAVGFDRLLRLAVLVALLAACLQILAPFFGALVWGAIIAVTLWPVFARITAWLGGRRGWAATIVALLLFVLLVLPLTLAGASLARGVEWLLAQNFDLSHLGEAELPGWVGSIPMIGSSLVAWWAKASQNFGALATQMLPYFKDGTVWLLTRGIVAGVALFQILVAIFLAAYLLSQHEDTARLARGFAQKLEAERGLHLLDLAARTVRSVSLGVIGSAFAQAVLAAVGFVVCGVPGVGALSFLTFLVAVIQLPTLLVWAPAAIWLYWSGETGWSIALGLWGLLVINTVDNVLRPMLISQGAKLPLILIFTGVIGGLLAWGFLGLFIGPTILAVCYTLFTSWLEEKAEVAAVESSAAVPDEAGAAPGPVPPAS